MDYEPVNQYINFLWHQFQYDWGMFTNPWILYPVIPAAAYLVFFVCKWYVLLAPITVPITIYRTGSGRDESVNIKDQLSDRLK